MVKGRPFRILVVGGRGRDARGACDRPYAATDGRTAAGRPRAATTVVRLTSYATHTRSPHPPPPPYARAAAPRVNKWSATVSLKIKTTNKGRRTRDRRRRPQPFITFAIHLKYCSVDNFREKPSKWLTNTTTTCGPAPPPPPRTRTSGPTTTWAIAIRPPSTCGAWWCPAGARTQQCRRTSRRRTWPPPNPPTGATARGVRCLHRRRPRAAGTTTAKASRGVFTRATTATTPFPRSQAKTSKSIYFFETNPPVVINIFVLHPELIEV